MVHRLVLAAALLAVPLLPAAAWAQTGAGVTGQQQSQPSPNQNQPQTQSSNAQQPPNARALPPSASPQNQPNPLPQLAK